MLNYIWLGLIVLAVVIGVHQGNLADVTGAAFDSAKTAVMNLALPLAGVMALWLGIMQLAEKSGIVRLIALGLRPILRRIFPDVPSDHPAMGAIVMNMAANMLGLANAATPLGLRAMQHLERLNPRPGTATNAMCTFLALNTSSVQLIPASAVAILAAAGSKEPTAIIGTAFLATICSTVAGLVSVKTLEKLPIYRLPAAPPPRANPEPEPSPEEDSADSTRDSSGPDWRGRVAVGAVLALFAWALYRVLTSDMVNPEEDLVTRVVETISLLAIPFILVLFPVYAAAKGVPVYEEFVEGAKEGFQVALRIIPFLVAILVAIGMFRAAGGIDLMTRLLDPLMGALHFPPQILPLALIRPLSGSGALGVFSELVEANGPDSLVALIGGTIMGSTETTFYVITVYFGSIGVRRTRHAVPAGLIADATGIIAAVLICNLAFG